MKNQNLSNRVFPNQFVARDESVRVFLDSVVARAKMRAVSATPHDKANNPLLATCSGPGGGKSRFVDELSDLFSHIEQNEHVGPKTDENAFLYGLVPIPISYQATSLFNPMYDAKGTGGYSPPGLALRVLFA